MKEFIAVKRLILLLSFLVQSICNGLLQNTPHRSCRLQNNHRKKIAPCITNIRGRESEDEIVPVIVQNEKTKREKMVLQAYTSHWDKILLDEYRAQSEELKERRKTWSKSRLESSGMCIFGASAEPDSEVFGDKIVKIYKPNGRLGKSNNVFRDNFSRGDVLVLTPENDHGLGRRFDVPIVPRECLVVDVGSDWLSLAVGPTWPVGLWETRKKGLGAFLVRLDRTAPQAPLKAQQKALERIRRGDGGKAAKVLAGLFHPQYSKHYLQESRGQPDHFQSSGDEYFNLENDILNALEEAIEENSFRPNQSQIDSITWALQRHISLIRGPPGTGKTR